MRQQEDKHRTYNPNAAWLKYRRVLVDWICESFDKIGMELSTAHVAVAYLDRVLHSVSVKRDRLQLVATVCILAAAKYEENFLDVPSLSFMVKNVQWGYSVAQIRAMELEVLGILK